MFFSAMMLYVPDSAPLISAKSLKNSATPRPRSLQVVHLRLSVLISIDTHLKRMVKLRIMKLDDVLYSKSGSQNIDLNETTTNGPVSRREKWWC